MREMSKSFSSTWLNFYHFNIDGNSLNFKLYFNLIKQKKIFADILYNNLAKHFVKTVHNFSFNNLNFLNLNEIFLFKLNANESTNIQIGIILNLINLNKQILKMEFLIERKNQLKVINNFIVNETITNQSFKLISINYGAKLDLKNEIFYDFISILHLVFFYFYFILFNFK